jgi:hypothetical protein
MKVRAQEMARTLLDTYEPEPLDANITRDLENVILDASRKLE